MTMQWQLLSSQHPPNSDHS